MSRNCSWCNRYIADNAKYWYKDVHEDGKTYKSKEIFCSAKCSHQYPYSPTADKFGCLGRLVILIIIGAVIYFITSNNSQSTSSNSEPVKSEYNTSENNSQSEYKISEDDAQSENITPEDESQINSTLNSEFRNLEFFNDTKETIYLALAYFNNTTWESHGYFKIEPNNNHIISLPESFIDDLVYWYAIDAVNNEWSGSDKNFCIYPGEKFDFYGNESEACEEFSKGFHKLIIEGAKTRMVLSNS
jgi:uncharacterized membrane protein